MLTQQLVGQPQNQHECVHAYMYTFIHTHKHPLNTLEFFNTSRRRWITYFRRAP